MEFIKKEDIKAFLNSGVVSEQIIYPENSNSERVTITRVTVSPGAEQPRHLHESSEQIWVAVEGVSTLLLADEQVIEFAAGDAVRFADGDIHGLKNDSNENFCYISVTSPPINFRDAYNEEN